MAEGIRLIAYWNFTEQPSKKTSFFHCSSLARGTFAARKLGCGSEEPIKKLRFSIALLSPFTNFVPKKSIDNGITNLLNSQKQWLTLLAMIALPAALASTNVLLALSLKAQSILLTPVFALTAVLVLMFAPLALLLRANNHAPVFLMAGSVNLIA